MPLYECTFIVRQDLSVVDAEKLADNFIKIIQDHDGKIIKKEYWGLRTLAYLIRKNKKGHYFLLGIDSSFEGIKEMERKMKLNEDLLRHLIIKVESIEEKLSPLMNSNSSEVDFVAEVVEEIVVLEEIGELDE